ncbi:hypothetical protein [Caenispirillum bisanense]|uniref:hypothetical protein n=1 Tax=Caenispirillum bisanense TaxID=414052 RepID=UPI0031D0CACB
MSVINRFEIANFLNLDNVEPRKAQWQTHYPHLLLHLRGQSAAIVATNGMGKSTLNRAIYCMLTRDQGFAQTTKAVCAPRRKGVYTHIRVELLYRDQPVGGLLGHMGVEVPGEPYVFGIYGNADSELTFYYYQGNFEDCPCVERTGTKVRVISNQQFRDRLKAQRDAHPNLTREGSLELVAKHFDLAMLAQLVAYQKAGGGDSAEEFFRVKTRRSDGQVDAYDAAFFYEHIAPEVLANAMRGFGKDDETRFEDTILNSASPLIRAELKNERLGQSLEKDKRTFSELEKVRAKLKAFLDERARLDRLVNDLGGEVAFVLDVVEQRPLPGVPPVLNERNEQVRQVANGLVKQGGEWLVPDALLAELAACESREINQDAERHGFAGRALSRKEVIAIPCDNLTDNRGRGAAGRGYALTQAVTLVQRRPTFAAGWDRESALRALNYGFEYRADAGDTNPFRQLVASMESEQKAHTGEIASLDEQCDALRRQQAELFKNIQSLQADAFELKSLRDSGVFTSTELADLEAVAPTVGAARGAARQARELHVQRRIALQGARDAHASFVELHGDLSPKGVLAQLEADCHARTVAHRAANLAHEAAKRHEQELKAAVGKARSASEEKTKERHRIELLLEPVERFEQHFPGENPVGLSVIVRQQRDDAIEQRAKLQVSIDSLGSEQTTLTTLAGDNEQFRTVFPNEEPDGLEAKVSQRLAEVERRLQELPSDLTRQTRLVESLMAGAAALQYAESVAAGRPVPGLEAAFREEQMVAAASAQEVATKLASAEADATVIASFRAAFPDASSPAAQRQKRTERLTHVIGNLDNQQKRAERLARQLEDLKKSATAAGRIASEVLEVVGGSPRRVHQVIEEELAGEEHRATVLTHFSHVLHAPVAETIDDARHMLAALDAAEIESPIFWLDGLRKFCRHPDVDLRDGLATGTFAGGATLQVQGLIDPHQVERTRAEIAANLRKAEEAVEALTAERDELDEASSASQLVRDACAADERGLVAKLDALRGDAAEATAREAELAALITEDSVQRLREAERYLGEGGEERLAAEQEQLSDLASEQAELEAERPAAVARASPSSLTLIRQAVSFLTSGGAARLIAVEAGLRKAREDLAMIENDLPRLEERAARIPDIQAAEQFARAGGRDTLALLRSRINDLKQALDEAEAAHEEGMTAVADAEQAASACREELSKAEVALAGQRPLVERAQGYLDADGPAFERDYLSKLDELQAEERRCDARASFRLELAISGLVAEREGRTVSGLQDQHGRLDAEINAAQERKVEVEGRIADLKPQLKIARERMKRLDTVVHALLERRRQARLAASAVEIALSATGKPSELLARAMASAERVRLGLGDELDEHLLDELEEVVADLDDFQLDRLTPSIKASSGAKDRYWKAYMQAVEALRDDKALTLSHTDRSLLDEALAADRTSRIEQLFSAFEKHVGDQERVWTQAKEDIDNERQKLSESLEAFTFQVEDHFKLLKSCLKPSNDGSEAGFEIEAAVLGRDGLRHAVDRVIAMIKRHEASRAADEEAGEAISQSDFEKRLKEEIRRSFYRAVFSGKKDAEGREYGGPRVYLRHPRIGRGERMQLTKKISTGQANALALLLMTKMADFAIHRDERDSLASAGKRRGSTHQTRVVMIDGLFSNVSNRKLIRESLDALRTLKGKFQLIGWIHNEAYENDPQIFPEHLGLRRIGDGEGFVVVDDQHQAIDDDVLTLGEGAVDVIELHVDKLPEDQPNV